MKGMIPIVKPSEPQNLAKDFYIGHTHIQICTDYCCNREDVPTILKRIADRVLESLAVSVELSSEDRVIGAEIKKGNTYVHS